MYPTTTKEGLSMEKATNKTRLSLRKICAIILILCASVLAVLGCVYFTPTYSMADQGESFAATDTVTDEATSDPDAAIPDTNDDDTAYSDAEQLVTSTLASDYGIMPIAATATPTIYWYTTPAELIISSYDAIQFPSGVSAWTATGNFLGTKTFTAAPWTGTFTKVSFDGTVVPTNMQYWFYNLTNVTSINFTHLDTSLNTSCYRLFYGMTNLTQIDISGLDLSACTTFQEMFFGCTNLQRVITRTSNGSTAPKGAKATAFTNMFANCSNLEEVDLTVFTPTGATSLNTMFTACYKLKEIDISTFTLTSAATAKNIYPAASGVALTDSEFNRFTFNKTFAPLINKTNFNVPTVVVPWFYNNENTAFTTYDELYTWATGYFSANASASSVTIFRPYTNKLYYSISGGHLTISDQEISKTSISSYATTSATPFTSCDTASSVSFLGNVRPASMMYWFHNFTRLEAIDFSNLDTTYTSTLQYAFYNTGLESLDLTPLNCTNIINATYMIAYNTKLQSVSMRGMDFPALTTAPNMIRNNSVLETLDIGGWTAPKLTGSITYMFGANPMLQEVELNGFNAMGVTDTSNMFTGDTAIKRINMPDFAGAVANVSGMFNATTSLEFLDISSLVCSAVAWSSSTTTTYNKFMYNMNNLKDLRISPTLASNISRNRFSLGTNRDPSVYNPWYLVTGAQANLDISQIDVSQLRDGERTVFTSLTTAGRYVNIIDPYIYWGLSDLGELTLSAFPRTEYTNGNFGGGLQANGSARWANQLASIKAVRLDGQVTIGTCQGLFYGMTNLASVDLYGLNTICVQSFSNMFYTCPALESVDVSMLNTTNARTMNSTFAKSTKLKTIVVGSISTDNVTDFAYMFDGCSSLVTVDLTKFNTSKATTIAYMFRDCTSLVTLDLSSFYTPLVTTNRNLVAGCTSLRMLDISNFSTAKLATVTATFNTLSSLQDFRISKDIGACFVAGKWTTMGDSTPTTFNPWFLVSDRVSAPEEIDKHGLPRVEKIADLSTAGRYVTATTPTVYWGIDRNGVLTLSATPRTDDIVGSYSGGLSGGRWNNDTHRPLIKSMRVEGTVSLGSFTSLFEGLTSLVSVDFTGMDTSYAYSANNAFYGCTALKTIDFAGADFRACTTFASMFQGCSALESMDTSSFLTSKATTFANMFYGCASIKTLNVSQFDTSSATTMAYMFRDCTSITELDLSGYNTGLVTTFKNTFYNCSNLRKLDISNFSTAKSGTTATNYTDMLYLCGNLQDLRISANIGSQFSAGRIATMGDATPTAICPWFLVSDTVSRPEDIDKHDLVRIEAPAKINAAGRYVSAVTPTIYWGIDGNGTLTLSDTPRDDSTVGSFPGGLTSASRWTELYAAVITAVRVEGQITVGTCVSMFINLTKLETADLTGMDTSYASAANSMFEGCTALTSVIVKNSDFRSATTLASMFYNCKSLPSIDLSNFLTSSATTMASMFRNCSSMMQLDLTKFDTTKVTTFGHMFNGLTNLTMLDCSSFSTAKATTFTSMFLGLSYLGDFRISGNLATKFAAATWTTIGDSTPTATNPWFFTTDMETPTWDIDKTNLRKVSAIGEFNAVGRYITASTTMVYWGINANGELILSPSPRDDGYVGSFPGGTSAARWNSATYIPIVNSVRVEGKIALGSMANMFQGLTNLVSVDFSGLDTTNVYSAAALFYGCTALKNINFAGATFKSSTSFAQMFYNCASLESVDVSTFDTSLSTNFSEMFRKCSKLKSIDLTNFRTPVATNTSYMFSTCGDLETILVPNFDVSKVTTMYGMFQTCSSLKELDLSSFNAPLCTDFRYFLDSCKSLKKLDMSNFTTTKASTDNHAYIMNTLNSLQDLRISVAMASRFSGGVITTTGESTPSTYNPWYLVSDTSSKVEDINKHGSTVATEMKGINAAGRWVLAATPRIYWGLDNVTGELVLSDQPRTENQNGEYQGGTATPFWANNATWVPQIKSVRIDGKISIGSGYRMFYNMTSLVSVDFTGADTSYMINAAQMFDGCTALKTVVLKNSTFECVTTMNCMFRYCNVLEDFDITNFNAVSVTDMGSTFRGCSTLTELDLKSFNTSKVTSYSRTFQDCASLLMLDLSSFSTAKTTNFDYTFNGLSSLHDFRMSSDIANKFSGGTWTTLGNSTPSNNNKWFLTNDMTSKPEAIDKLALPQITQIKQFNTAGRYITATSPMVYWGIFNNGELTLSDHPQDGIYTGSFTGGSTGARWNNATYINMVLTVRIDGYISLGSCYQLFQGLSKLVTADLTGLDTSFAYAADNMFYGCTSLKTIIFNNSDFRSSTTMANMFYNCQSLENMDTSKLTAPLATTLASMFYNCSKLKSIDLSKYDTSKVTTMANMFYGCSSLESVDLQQFNTPVCTNMSYMFYNCSSLKTLDVTPLTTTKVTNMNYMFSGASGLEMLDASTFSTASISKYTNSFTNMHSLHDLRLSANLAAKFSAGWWGSIGALTPSIYSVWYFAGTNMEPLKQLDFFSMNEITAIKQFNAAGRYVNNMTATVYWGISYDDVLTLSTTPRTSDRYSGTFTGSATGARWNNDTYNPFIHAIKIDGAVAVGSMYQLFYGLTYLETADLTGLDTSAARSFEQAFYGCTSLKSINANTLDVRRVTTLHEMFENCYALEEIDLSNWETLALTTATRVFRNCTSVKNIYLDKFDTTKVTSFQYMFCNCPMLEKLDLRNFDAPVATNMRYFFSGCTSIKEIDLRNLTTPRVTQFTEMFYRCFELEVLNIGKLALQASLGTDGFWRFMTSVNSLRDLTVSAWYANGNSTVKNYFNHGRKPGTYLPWYYIDDNDPDWKLKDIDCGKYIANEILVNTGFTKEGRYITPITVNVYWEVSNGELVLSAKPLTGTVTGSFLGAVSSAPNFSAQMANITSVRVDKDGGPIVLGSLYRYFRNFTAVQHIDLDGIDTRFLTVARQTFDGCTSLQSVNLNTLEVSHFKNFLYMFQNCTSLTEILVPSWITSSATTMAYMFYGCTSLTNLDISSFDTARVTDFNRMFYNVNSIKELNVKHLNGESATTTEYMFGYCSSLEKLDLSGFKTNSKLTKITGMFRNCTNMVSLNLSQIYFNSASSSYRNYVFTNLYQIKEIIISDDLAGQFAGGTTITTFSYPTENTPWYYVAPGNEGKEVDQLPQDATRTSYKQFNLAGRYITNIDYYVFWALNDDVLTLAAHHLDGDRTGTVVISKNFKSSPFSSVAALTRHVNVEGSLSVSSMAFWFNSFQVAQSINLTGINSHATKTMQSMFLNCQQVTDLVIGQLDVSGVENFANMFQNCASLTYLDLSTWRNELATTMIYMFSGCTSLKTVDFSNVTGQFTAEKVTTMQNMFANCTSLEYVGFEYFNPELCTTMKNMFSGCSSLKSVDLSGFNNTKSLTDMSYMFYDCASLESLDLSGVYMQSVTTLAYSFYKCGAMKTINFGSSFTAGRITTMQYMLYHCSSLTSLDLGNFLLNNFNLNYASNYRYSLVSLEALQEIRLSQSFVTKHAGNPIGKIGLSAIITKDTPWYEKYGSGSITAPADMLGDTWYYNPFAAPIYWYVDDNNMFITSNEEEAKGHDGVQQFIGSTLFGSGYTPWYEHREKITKITITGSVTPASTAYWFQNFSSLVEIDLSGLRTSASTSVAYMFDGCSSLKSLDISTMGMDAVKNYNYFLRGLDSIINISINAQQAGMMVKYGFVVSVPLWHQTLGDITKAQEMVMPGDYFGGARITFSDRRGWTKVVAVSFSSKKVDIASIDFSSRPIPAPDMVNHIIYVDFYEWVYADGTPVNFDYIEGNVTVYAEYTYLTFDMPEGNMVYDGSSTHLITVKNPFTLSYTISYFYCPDRRNGVYNPVDSSNTVNAGYYYARITVGTKYVDSAVYHVSPIVITVDYGLRAVNKEYDQTVAATILTDGIIPDGVLAQDRATFGLTARGQFTDPNVGEGKLVHITEITSTSPNYVVDLANSQLETYASIWAKDLTGDVVATGLEDKTYTGSAITQNLVLSVAGKRVTLDVDYRLDYMDNTEAGTASIVVTGINNYTGIETLHFNINKKNIGDGDVIGTIDPATYNGSPITNINITMTYNGVQLVQTNDYVIVTITDNINAGTATVTLHGAGKNYTGSKTLTFKINPLSLADCQLVFIGLQDSYLYDGAPISPTFTLIANGLTLRLGDDYSASYLNNSRPGTASIRVTGRGNYTGSATKEYKITSLGFDECKIYFEHDELPYNGTVQKQIPIILGKDALPLAESDYRLSYSSDLINAGTVTVTITGYNKYLYAETQVSYKITPITLEDHAIGDIASVIYNRREQMPTPVVSKDGKSLIYNVDFTVDYTNNINVGTANVTVTGKGNYYGNLYSTFQITQATITSVSLQVRQVYYNGTAQMPKILTVAAGNFVLNEDEYELVYLNTDRTVYQGNFIDACEIIVQVVPKSGNANVTGSAEITYTIRPAIISNMTASFSQAQFTGFELIPDVLSVYASNGYVLSFEKGEYYLEYYRANSSNIFDESKQTTDFIKAGKIKIVAKSTSPNFTSYASFIYEITRVNIQDPDVTIKYYFVQEGSDNPATRVYMTGDQYLPGKKVAPEVWYQGQLMSQEFYTYQLIAISGNEDRTFTSVGTYNIVVTGIGSFMGSVVHTYKINPNQFSPEYIEVELKTREFIYNGLPHTYDFDTDEIIVYDATDPENKVRLYLDEHFVLANGPVKITDAEGIERTFKPVNGYISNVDAGNAILVLTGKDGQYTNDVIIVQFTILPREITDADLGKIADRPYNNGYQKPDVTLIIAATDLTAEYQLVNSKDYTISYLNNLAVGVATVTVTGINNFKGTITTSFNITQKDIADSDILKNGLDAVEYNGREQKPHIVLLHVVPGDPESPLLLEASDDGDKDYIIIFGGSDFTNPGSMTVYLFGTNNYTGSVELTYTINKLRIFQLKLSDGVYSYAYDGTQHDLYSKTIATYGYNELQNDNSFQYVTGTADKSGYNLYYQVEQEDGTWGEKIDLTDSVRIVDAGRYKVVVVPTDEGPYRTTAEVSYIFEIEGILLTPDNAKIGEIESFEFTGAEIKPEPTVTYNGTILRNNVDYTLSYSNNINVGNNAVVKVTGKGGFKGSLTATFSITPKNIDLASVVIVDNELPYNGTNQSLTGDNVYFTLPNGYILRYGVDFTFEYVDEQRISVGTYKFYAKGMGNFVGETSSRYDFMIIPRDLSTLDFGTLDPVTYTGKLLQPVFDLVDPFGNVALQVGTDIVFSYGDASTNINVAWTLVDGELVVASKAIVIVSAGTSGNYTGMVVLRFAIAPVDLATDENITLDPITGTYVLLNEPIKVIPTVRLSGDVLDQLTFRYEFIGADQPGEATVNVIAYEGSNFINQTYAKYTILDPNARPDLSDDEHYQIVVTPDFPDIEYDGQDHTPDWDSIKVYVNGELLVRGVDYDFEYSMMDGYFKTIGKKEFDIVAVKGGRFQGSKKITFNITGVGDTVTAYLYYQVEDQDHEIRGNTWQYNSLDVKQIGLHIEVKSGRTPKIVYYRDNGGGSRTVIDGIENAAGKYFIRITLAEQGDYGEYIYDVTYEITPIEITFSGIKAKDKEYDGKTTAVMDDSALYISGIVNNDEIGLAADLDFEDEDAGVNKTVYIKNAQFIGVNGNNYVANLNDCQSTTTATITPKTILVMLNIPETDMVYVQLQDIDYDLEGFSQTTGRIFSIFFTYRGSAEDQAKYSTKDTMPNHIGTYDVKIDFASEKAKKNFRLHEDSVTTGVITIKAAQITDAHILPIGDQEYTGDPITPEVMVMVEGVILNPETDYTVEYSNNVKVGENTAVVKVTGKGNFSGTGTAHFTIYKPEITIRDLHMDDWIYGEGPKDPTYVAPKFETYTITYAGAPDENGNITYTATPPTKVGTYTVRVTAKTGAGTENEVFEECTFRILPKELTVDIEGGEYIYGKQVQPAKVKVSGIVGEDNVHYTVYYVNEESHYFSTELPTEAGEYTIKVELTDKLISGGEENEDGVVSEPVYEPNDNANYTISTTGLLIIRPLEAKVVIDIENWMYGDPASEPRLSFEDAEGRKLEGITLSYKFVYSDSADGEFTETVPTTPGTYYVKAVFEESKSISVTQEPVSFEITRRIITVTVIAAEGKIYDGNTDAVVTITGTNGILDSDVIVITAKGKFSDKNAARNKVVTAYDFVISGDNAEYYEIDVVASSKVRTMAAITAREVTVTLTGIATHTYLDTLNFGFTVDNAVAGDKIVELRYRNVGGTVFNSLPVDVGGYTAYVELVNTNYILLNNPTQDFDVEPFTITKEMAKPIDVQPFEDTAVEPGVVIVAKGYTLVQGKDFEVTYSDNENPGTAKAHIKGIGNFVGEFDLEFTIIDFSLFVEVEGYEGVFDGDEHEAFATRSAVDRFGQPATDVTWTYTWNGQTFNEVPKFRDVGVYVVHYKVTDKYGKFLEGDITVTITIVQLTDVAVEGYLGVYDGMEHPAVKASNCKTVGGEEAVWTFSMDEGEEKTYGEMPNLKNAGTYTVYYKVSAPNHEDYYGQFTVTIYKAEISGSWNKEGTHPVFEPTNPEDADLFDITYVDDEGNTVPEEELVPGNHYTAKVKPKDDDNYEILGETEIEFVMGREITLFELIEENKTFRFFYSLTEEIEDYSEHDYDPERMIYLTNIAAMDTLSDIIAQFKNEEVRAFRANGEEIEDLSEIIATGMILRVYGGEDIMDELTLSIKGDVDGSGTVTSNDETQITNYVKGTNPIEGAFLLAADVDYSGTVTSNDETQVTNYVKGGNPIFDGLSVHKEDAAAPTAQSIAASNEGKASGEVASSDDAAIADGAIRQVSGMEKTVDIEESNSGSNWVVIALVIGAPLLGGMLVFGLYFSFAKKVQRRK